MSVVGAAHLAILVSLRQRACYFFTRSKALDRAGIKKEDVNLFEVRHRIKTIRDLP